MKIQLVSAASDADNNYPNVRKSEGKLLLPQWYDKYKQSRVDLEGLHWGLKHPLQILLCASQKDSRSANLF